MRHSRRTEPEVGPADLPLAPQWLLDKLAAAQRPVIALPVDSGDGKIPDGKRNGTLTKLAGAMRRQAATEPEIFAAISIANQQRCNPPLEEKEIATIAASVARYAPGDVSQYLAQLEADAESDESRSPEDPGALPSELLHVPGFIADVVAYNLAGAHKEQPALALAGGLTLLGSLTGRKVTDTQAPRAAQQARRRPARAPPAAHGQLGGQCRHNPPGHQRGPSTQGDRCPQCGGAMVAGVELVEAVLSCSGCGQTWGAGW